MLREACLGQSVSISASSTSVKVRLLCLGFVPVPELTDGAELLAETPEVSAITDHPSAKEIRRASMLENTEWPLRNHLLRDENFANSFRGSRKGRDTFTEEQKTIFDIRLNTLDAHIQEFGRPFDHILSQLNQPVNKDSPEKISKIVQYAKCWYIVVQENRKAERTTFSLCHEYKYIEARLIGACIVELLNRIPSDEIEPNKRLHIPHKWRTFNNYFVQTAVNIVSNTCRYGIFMSQSKGKIRTDFTYFNTKTCDWDKAKFSLKIHLIDRSKEVPHVPLDVIGAHTEPLDDAGERIAKFVYWRLAMSLADPDDMRFEIKAQISIFYHVNSVTLNWDKGNLVCKTRVPFRTDSSKLQWKNFTTCTKRLNMEQPRISNTDCKLPRTRSPSTDRILEELALEERDRALAALDFCAGLLADFRYIKTTKEELVERWKQASEAFLFPLAPCKTSTLIL